MAAERLDATHIETRLGQSSGSLRAGKQSGSGPGIPRPYVDRTTADRGRADRIDVDDEGCRRARLRNDNHDVIRARTT